MRSLETIEIQKQQGLSNSKGPFFLSGTAAMRQESFMSPENDLLIPLKPKFTHDLLCCYEFLSPRPRYNRQNTENSFGWKAGKLSHVLVPQLQPASGRWARMFHMCSISQCMICMH
eukprot:1150314-Pelagomonas_calceolata.AAC.1